MFLIILFVAIPFEEVPFNVSFAIWRRKYRIAGRKTANTNHQYRNFYFSSCRRWNSLFGGRYKSNISDSKNSLLSLSCSFFIPQHSTGMKISNFFILFFPLHFIFLLYFTFTLYARKREIESSSHDNEYCRKLFRLTTREFIVGMTGYQASRQPLQREKKKIFPIFRQNELKGRQEKCNFLDYSPGKWFTFELKPEKTMRYDVEMGEGIILRNVTVKITQRITPLGCIWCSFYRPQQHSKFKRTQASNGNGAIMEACKYFYSTKHFFFFFQGKMLLLCIFHFSLAIKILFQKCR